MRERYVTEPSHLVTHTGVSTATGAVPARTAPAQTAAAVTRTPTRVRVTTNCPSCGYACHVRHRT